MQLIAKVEVKGHTLTPWSTPVIGNSTSGKTGGRHRFTVKNPALKKFQDAIKRAGRAVMKKTVPYDSGPVYLRTKLTRKTEDKALWGQWCYDPKTKKNAGDLTNLVKAAEDAIAGVVFSNDRIVAGQSNVIVWGEEDGVSLEAMAINPVDSLRA